MAVSKLPYPPVKPHVFINVKASKGLTPSGAQNIVEEYSGLGFYEERNAWVQNAEGKKVESKGLVIFFHDICTSAEELTGFVEINSNKMSIITGKRFRNPDGTVHHVELELK